MIAWMRYMLLVEQGIKVDGVHVGQTDIPVEACRALLGPDAVVGLSARADEMLEYVKTADMSLVDYLGVGPLHETPTKTDCGLAADGTIITKSLEDLVALHQASPVPIVVGGGVKVADIPARCANRRRRLFRGIRDMCRARPACSCSRTRASMERSEAS